MKYAHLTVGGTFDHFHKGHREVIEKAFASGETVWLGITSSAYFSRLDHKTAKNFDTLQPYAERRNSIIYFLKQKGLIRRAKLVPIDDKYGTTLTDQNIEAIVVSPETELVATEINLLRAQKNWPALEVITIPWVLANDGKPVSSMRIRGGEIDREGKVFRLAFDWGVRSLPNSLRQELRKPLGKLLSDLSYLGDLSNLKTRLLIAVGDVVTNRLLSAGVVPDISIVDLKIARKPAYKNIAELGFRNIKVIRKAKNDPGTLNISVYQALFSLIESEAKPAVLLIEGEEDLLTLLAIYLAPLNSLIVYGQPNFARASSGKGARRETPVKKSEDNVREGVVVVEAGEERKQLVHKYLKRFRSRNENKF